MQIHRRCRFGIVFAFMGLAAGLGATLADEPKPALQLTARSLRQSPDDSDAYLVRFESLNWKPAETAVIVCDMWDYHSCLNATKRVDELAPRVNDFVSAARKQGVLVVHAPSDCMAAHDNHPARTLAKNAPRAANLPEGIDRWCKRLPAEEQSVYPIDDSDDGCDTEPMPQAAYAIKLQSLGRNPRQPWKSQHPAIAIESGDAISDSGGEIWNLFEQRCIKNVVLLGVHTNRCVLGRPFGLRQMSKNGKNVVLARDLTDTMYNPARWPHVNHFTSIDLIVEHIEKYVCPTISSEQLLGGKAFRFSADRRPHLVMVIADLEYDTDRTLPQFARRRLGRDFKVSLITWPKRNSDELPGIEILDDADLALLSVWRRTPPAKQMEAIRRFVAAGKPIVGLRVASHAFAKRDGKVADGHAAWPTFCADVFDANYQGHFRSGDKRSTATIIWASPDAAAHSILQGIPEGQIPAPSWLYKMRPLGEKSTLLMTGRVVEGENEEPVAWTTTSPAGGRVFYTSLGHPKEFDLPWFDQLLSRAIYWCVELPIPDPNNSLPRREQATD